MAHLRSRSTAVAALVAAVVAGCGAAPESGAPEEATTEGENLDRIPVLPPANTIHISGRNTPGPWQILDGALFNTYAVRRFGGESRAHLIGVNGSSDTMQACGYLVCTSGFTSTSIPINATLVSSKGFQAQFAEVTVATLPSTCGIFTVDLTLGPPGRTMAFICGFL